MARYSDIKGKYLYLDVEGVEHRVFLRKLVKAFLLFVSIQQDRTADSGVTCWKIKMLLLGFE
jgi:hypothetical protein